MKRAIAILFILILACAPCARAQTSPAAKTEPDKTGVKKIELDCGCETSFPSDVVAIVNGLKVLTKDLDSSVSDQIAAMHGQVIEARKRELYLQINSRLLEAEAKRRGISAISLLKEEVVSKVKDPTDEVVQAFYDENKERIGDEFKNVKGEIITYLRSQQEGQEAKKLADRLRATADVKILVTDITPPKTEADRARVLATVNTEPITSANIEDSLSPLIFNIQGKLYELRKHQLNLRINTILLEQEAQKRKVTTVALMDAEITPKVKRVTDDDAQNFYAENKEKIAGDFAQLKPQIITYLQQRERRSAEAAYAEQMRQAAAVEVKLTPPRLSDHAITGDDQPVKGNVSAAVTIVEFTDFECPSCAKAQPIIERLVREYEGKVRLVVRDYPLERHANAFKAAEAAEAAREQEKYWEYAAMLFENQQALGIDKLKEYASKLGLDRAKFDAALSSGKFSEKVQRDIQAGWKLGVNSTPTLFVNGRLVSEKTYEGLKAVVESALKETAKK